MRTCIEFVEKPLVRVFRHLNTQIAGGEKKTNHFDAVFFFIESVNGYMAAFIINFDITAINWSQALTFSVSMVAVLYGILGKILKLFTKSHNNLEGMLKLIVVFMKKKLFFNNFAILKLFLKQLQRKTINKVTVFPYHKIRSNKTWHQFFVTQHCQAKVLIVTL